MLTDGEPCGRPVRAKGLCNGHYKRLNEFGDVQADVPIQKKRRGYTEECDREGCTEPAIAKGLCRKHYMEERENRLSQEKCKNPECNNPQGTTGGYCPACYSRFLTYGDPNAGPPRRKRRSDAGKPRSQQPRSEYHVNHAMVRKERDPAWQHTCEHCGDGAQTWAMIHGTTGESPDDYMPLCWRCHAKYDDFAARLPDNRGSKRSAESRELMRQAAQQRWADPAAHEKMSEIAREREARKRAEREAG